MEAWINSDLDLDELADSVRRILGIGGANLTTHQHDQRRDGLNWGGLYYLFEVLGFEIYLLENQGEVEIIERSDWPYYLLVHDAAPPAEVVARRVAETLRKGGLVAEFDDLC